MTPPLAEKRPHVHVEHGVRREDPWYWLRNREDPAVLAHLGAENAWTTERLAPLEPLRKQLYAEMLGRIQETDSSVPAPEGPWEYYHRTEAGRPYGIHCRRPRGGGPEQILLDVNVLGEGRPFVSVATVDTSPDHRICAYSTDFTGAERYTLRFRDLETGAELPDTIENASGTVAWANDSRTVLWAELDVALRSFRIRRHTLGTEGPDPVVYEETDERFRVIVYRNLSGRYLSIWVGNQATTETSLLSADNPAGPVYTVFPRQRGAKYRVTDVGRDLFVLTNVGVDGVPGSAVNYRLLQIPFGEQGLGEGFERLPHRPDAELVDIDGFARHVVVTERDRGQLGLRILDPGSSRDHLYGEPSTTERWVPLPEVPCVIGVGTNLEYDTEVLRFEYTSLTTPPSTFEIDVDMMDVKKLKEQPVPGYDRTRYRTLRLEATAADGTRIPISVVHSVDVDLAKGPHPTVLYGYGAYGITIDPSFSPSRVSLLDRGVVFAIAHVRGGGFLGRQWYEDGKFLKKPNTFHDFVACAQLLIDRGLTAPDRLAMSGGSAGGLLVGAVMNLAPELFRSVLAAVPFVDIVSTMLDESLPLTAAEWEEWGDPRTPEFFQAMLAYSPYDNVGARAYPDVLAVAGLNDPRVQYWEPAKWVAKLRDRATSGEFLLLTHLGAGHQGRSGRYGALEDRALEYAWLLSTLDRA